MAKAGRPRKYKSVRALKAQVERYWRSISYEAPIVIPVPTGEVSDKGELKYKSQLLPQPESPDQGRTVTKFLEPPSVAGLLLFLGISRSTWSNYRNDEAMAPAVEYWDLLYEAYLVGQLENGKHITGVMFNLEHNYGWRHKADITGEGSVKISIDGEGEGELDA